MNQSHFRLPRGYSDDDPLWSVKFKAFLDRAVEKNGRRRTVLENGGVTLIVAGLGRWHWATADGDGIFTQE